MNRFTKKAAEFGEKKKHLNWFDTLPEKVQKEILEAIKQHDGTMVDLGAAIKHELKLTTSVQHVCAVLRAMK
jgi:hypothetical protein